MFKPSASRTPTRSTLWCTAALSCAIVGALVGRASAHNVYLANENHTDYGWNATTEVYDASMASELDYYLGRIDATAASPPGERARFNADCSYYLYNYQQSRTATQFERLIDAIKAGNVTVPLNPMVTLYGALPTEAAIRAGYYPGRIERQYGVSFTEAEEMENATIPWGIASLWAGSGVRYSWKGICGCQASGDYYLDQTTDAFLWQGPDDKTLLMKWYQFSGNNRSFGGYAEARDNLTPDGIQRTVDRDTARSLPVSGVFGYGWDDVNSQISDFETTAAAWNAAHPSGDQSIVSNLVDYFQELQSHTASLPTLRGGWGNDWDLLPATLAQRTALLRRAVEQMRTAEALAAVVHGRGNAAFWPSHQAALEAAWVDYYKYFEHTWTDGGVGVSYVVNNKKTWQEHFVDTVDRFTTDATAAFAALFLTPNEDRFVVFNPVAFVRTDYADLPVSSTNTFVVTDVASGAEVPSQNFVRDGHTYLRILASNVPSLGYRVYRYAPGPPSAGGCCTISGTPDHIENPRYRATLGERGQITSLTDETTGSQELSGDALNDFGSGRVTATMAENVGAVSATLMASVDDAVPRRVRVTLFRSVNRVEIENEILGNYGATSHYRFNLHLVQPQIHFEEVGAIARPGFAAQQGDFLPGTRTDYMTLNHFVTFADALAGYQITLASRDAFAMRIGASSSSTFDLPASEVSLLALGNVAHGQIQDQGGDASFRDDFALQGTTGPFSGVQAKKMGLAYQNPLRAIALPRSQSGSLTTPTGSFLSVSASNVVVTAFKPVEEGARGILVRLWEVSGSDTAFTVDATAFAPSAAFETSLIETDRDARPLMSGAITAAVGANEIKAYRFVPATATPTPSATPSAIVVPTATTTRGATRGDIDGDGMVTNGDLDALVFALFSSAPGAAADVNRDGRVTVADLTALLQLFQPESSFHIRRGQQQQDRVHSHRQRR